MSFSDRSFAFLLQRPLWPCSILHKFLRITICTIILVPGAWEKCFSHLRYVHLGLTEKTARRWR
jgi:hypothetical protein